MTINISRVEVISSQRWDLRWGRKPRVDPHTGEQIKPQFYPASVMHDGWEPASFVLLQRVGHSQECVIVMAPREEYAHHQEVWLTYEMLQSMRRGDPEDEALAFAELLFERELDSYYAVALHGSCCFFQGKLVLYGIGRPDEQPRAIVIRSDKEHKAYEQQQAEQAKVIAKLMAKQLKDVVKTLEDLLEMEVLCYHGKEPPLAVLRLVREKVRNEHPAVRNFNHSPHRVEQIELARTVPMAQQPRPTGIIKRAAQVFSGT